MVFQKDFTPAQSLPISMQKRSPESYLESQRAARPKATAATRQVHKRAVRRTTRSALEACLLTSTAAPTNGGGRMCSGDRRQHDWLLRDAWHGFRISVNSMFKILSFPVDFRSRLAAVGAQALAHSH